MAVVLLAVFVPLYYMGFFLGGMATDSCDHLPSAAFLWIEVGWPIVLLATALTAPVLIQASPLAVGLDQPGHWSGNQCMLVSELVPVVIVDVLIRQR